MRICPVCDGSGWLQAAPVLSRAWTERVPRVCWSYAVIVPCFGCAATPVPKFNEKLERLYVLA